MRILHLFLTSFIFPFYFIFLLYRILRGKEELKRVGERLGSPSVTSVDYKKIAIWVHAASVGESMLALSLIENLVKMYPNYNIVLTTSTISAAKVVADKLPPNVYHQYRPADFQPLIKSFIRHWGPCIAILIESEIWPSLIYEATKYFPVIIVNGAMSDKSYRIWRKFRWVLSDVLCCLSSISTQSLEHYNKFKHFLSDHRLQNIGNLKLANKKLTYNEQALSSLKNSLNGKKIFVAASTHQEDEEEIFKALCNLKQNMPDLFSIIIPRHPTRKEEVLAKAKKYNLTAQLRSLSPLPDLAQDLYIADTLGEVGLFYELADFVFVGGSFNKGGHNPAEPAAFGKLIFFGPDMSRIEYTKDQMLKLKAAIQVSDSNELQENLAYFMGKGAGAEIQQYQKNALDFIAQGQEIQQKYLELISKYVHKEDV